MERFRLPRTHLGGEDSHVKYLRSSTCPHAFCVAASNAALLRPAANDRGWSARAVALISRDGSPLTGVSSHAPVGSFQFRAGGIVP